MTVYRVERVQFVLSCGVRRFKPFGPACRGVGGGEGGAEMEESDRTGFTLGLSGVSVLLSEIDTSLKLRPAD